MPTPTAPTPIRLLPRLLAAALLAPILAAVPVGARGNEPFIYGLNEEGKLSINATVLDRLPGKSDPDDPDDPFAIQRWAGLVVRGSNRYALRFDGQLYKNGSRLYKLPTAVFVPGAVWLGLSVTPTAVYALRSSGELTANGRALATLPTAVATDSFSFAAVLGADPNVFSLRSDGAIFQNTGATPRFQLVGGNGIGGIKDGKGFDTVWVAMAVNPANGDLFALRRDGKIYTADLPSGPAAGSKVAALPFPTALPVSVGQLYVDIEFTAGGVWHVLRANGEVYTAANVNVPIADLPGDSPGFGDETYMDLATFGEEFWALRRDGRVFFNIAADQVLRLPRRHYRRIALSTDTPDLGSFRNPPPAAAIYKVTAVEGEPIVVPVVATDIERLPEDLEVTPMAIPPGAAWDDDARRLEWDDPGPAGTHLFSAMLSDGVNKPVTAVTRIKVIAADGDPMKNKKPIPWKIAKARALAGHEIELLIGAVDPDGDPVAISIDPDAPPFSLGATFDPATGIFAWTPTSDDLGKHTAVFRITDGTARTSLKVAILVVEPLIF